MTLHTTIYWVLISAIWYFANGALHDFFIVRNHKGKYDRELLRLLMDGHVLMLSGAILFVTFSMLRHDIPYAGWINSIIALGMLIYCAMIFPFLKSIVTIIISAVLLILSLLHILQ